MCKKTHSKNDIFVLLLTLRVRVFVIKHSLWVGPQRWRADKSFRMHDLESDFCIWTFSNPALSPPLVRAQRFERFSGPHICGNLHHGSVGWQQDAQEIVPKKLWADLHIIPDHHIDTHGAFHLFMLPLAFYIYLFIFLSLPHLRSLSSLNAAWFFFSSNVQSGLFAS